MLSVFLLALSLAVDAFAAAICCGVQASRLRFRDALTVGLWFGGFQAGMTLVGGLFGHQLSRYLWQAGALLSFGLLLFLGGRMLWSALFPDGGGDETGYDLRPGPMAALALATSLDALAAGVSLAFWDAGLITASAVIGGVAFALSVLGSLLGRTAGGSLSRWAGAAGGAVLIWLGVRVLLAIG